VSDQFFQRGAGGEAAWAAQQAAGTLGHEYVQQQLREAEQRGASERFVAERAQQLDGEAAAYRERAYYESTRGASAPTYSSASTAAPSSRTTSPSAVPSVTPTWVTSTTAKRKHSDTFVLRMWALGLFLAGGVLFLISAVMQNDSAPATSTTGVILTVTGLLLMFLGFCSALLSLWGN